MNPSVAVPLILMMLFASGVGTPADAGTVRLATSSSLATSGLMEVVAPAFEARSGHDLEVIAIESGKALSLGRAGRVDAVLVHASSEQDSFVETGNGMDRRPVMHIDFLIAGPRSDPAEIKGSRNVLDAFRRIERGMHPFVSRGDDSGNHTLEASLWRRSGLVPYGRWYHKTGLGMAATLTQADRRDAYVMVDRGTWIKRRSSVRLVPLFQGDDRLISLYSVILVNSARHPRVNTSGARAFLEWITSAEGQELIGSYRINGERLFIPAAATGVN